MNKGEIVELEIQDLAFGGQGVSKKDGFVVFVDGALPGQIVRAKIKTQKRRYAEANLVEVLKRSPWEKENGFQSVPGAPWATLVPEKQIEFKKRQVFDLFKKFAQKDLGTIQDEVISSPRIWSYRNKMEFSFGFADETSEEGSDGKKIWKHFGFSLGSKKRQQFWLVENLEKPSGIFDEDFEGFLPEIQKFCLATGLPAFDQKENQGFFRHLVVRKSFFENKFLINLVTTSTDKNKFPIKDFVQFLCKKFDQRIAGIFWSQNDSTSDSANSFVSRDLVYGVEKIQEEMCGLQFEISLNSFFQTNPASAEMLYNKVVQYCGAEDSGTILDLYCGTGTIGQILAKKLSKTRVIGVEIVESAVEDARKNAEKNCIKNIEFHCADVRKFLKERTDLKNSSTIVLDPPRAGIVPKALERIIEFAPQRIVYVSCNPATMARDTKVLEDAGYKLEKISIVDQFPHTSHVECVGRFNK